MALQLQYVFHETRNTFSITPVAGVKGLSKYFVWPHVLENIEAINFLSGNELIFTTGIGKNSDDWLKNYTLGLIHKGVSGLVVNLGPFIQEIDEEVIDLCNRNDFPIFTIPWQVHIADIIRDFCNRLFTDDQTQISNAEAFKNAIFYPNMPELFHHSLERDGYVLSDSFVILHIQAIQTTKSIEYNNFNSQYMFYLQLSLSQEFPHKCLYLQNDTFHIILNQVTKERLTHFIDELNAYNSKRHTNYEFHIGCSSIKQDISSLPLLHEQAVSTLELAKKQNLSYLLFDSSPINKLLLSVKDSSVLTDVYRDILGSITDYDKAHNTEYLETLKLYLENNSSIQAVADIKFTHRNTINNRIHKIKTIFQLDLSSPETRFLLLLAYHIQNTF